MEGSYFKWVGDVKDFNPPTEIHYKYGVAYLVRELWLCDNIIGRSEYFITANGEIREAHFDPEEGFSEASVDRKVLERTEQENPNVIPLTELFGRKRKDVEKILQERGFSVNHIDNTLN